MAMVTCLPSLAASASLTLKEGLALRRHGSGKGLLSLRRLAAVEGLRRKQSGVVMAMAGIESLTSSSPSFYAKEMERVAAKEALILAIQDAGGLTAASSGKLTEIGGIDVNERIITLERLNPTPRPTTSPLLDGAWQFKWAQGNSPGLFAMRVLLQRFPSAVASLEELNLNILDGSAKATARLKVFGVVDSSVILSSNLTAEGPARLKEEYVEGILGIPNLQEDTVPSQLKQAYYQVLDTFQRLPDLVKETVSNGIKIPLSGTFERQLLISYLDDEVLIARDVSGVPEVLMRIDGPLAGMSESVPEYIS